MFGFATKEFQIKLKKRERIQIEHWFEELS